ncbi:MAG: SMC-Scp complex subunit ScpB [Candidatus Pacebacteria bacterium]|nr:SMC-Scp complex subunit ScpB [Candidatus Paceibacterota bacterium]
MEKEHIIAALEALLFVYGEPMSTVKIAKVLSITEDELHEAIVYYKKLLEEHHRGLTLVTHENALLLTTKPSFSSFVERFVKEDLKEELTPAALETLSLIAYFGPISRAQIDYIRGVNSSFILRSLTVRGLVNRAQGKGLSYVYQVSFDFLKHMGVSSVTDLPEYNTYQQMKESYFRVADTHNEPVSSDHASSPEETT